MLPDPGCYQERYRPTSGAVPTVVASLVMVGLVMRTEAVWAAAAIIAAALAVLLVPMAAARRLTAFRADYAGLTLGAEPRALMVGRRADFIPWHEVDAIVLHPNTSGLPGTEGRVGRVEVRRRQALAAADGRPPEPGTTAVTRAVTGWRLDRERLALFTAAMAPGVPVIDAGAETGAAELGTAS